MSERWRSELRKLDELEPPPRMIDEARSRLPSGVPEATGRSRIVAAVVAFVVFALAGSFAWRAFETDPAVDPSPVAPAPLADLPVLTVRFTGAGMIDGDMRRVDTVIDYGDAREEDFTSTTPEGAIVEWVAVDDLTSFVPGPTVGGDVAIEADGEDPRVLIGPPDAWPDFDRFERIEQLPTTPGDYVLVFEADYAEGTARTARRVRIVEPGAVQLSLMEGGNLDAATATAYVDGTGVPGFLSSSSFAQSDVGSSTVPRSPELDGVEPLLVPQRAPLIVPDEIDDATAGLTETYERTPKELPLDLLAGGTTITSPPGDYLLAVDATWAHGKVGWASEGTRETARFFFPVQVTGTASSEEPPPPTATVEPSLEPIVVTSPSPGDEITSPVTVAGSADVFEGTVTVWVVDGTNNRIGEAVATATCGGGCRGDFSVEVPYSVGQTQAGEILVFEESAADGKRLNSVRIPVTLTPGPEDPVAAEVEGTWTDASGEPLPDGSGNAPLVMRVSEGPDHCGWTSVTFLLLAWPIGSASAGPGEDLRQYLRDPQGLLTDSQAVTFESRGELPDDAVPTGYQRGEWQLWIAPSDQDEAVYVVKGDPNAGGTWERWSRTTVPVGCD
jgi:hypothetical protein